jgi:putative thioredoxin
LNLALALASGVTRTPTSVQTSAFSSIFALSLHLLFATFFIRIPSAIGYQAAFWQARINACTLLLVYSDAVLMSNMPPEPSAFLPYVVSLSQNSLVLIDFQASWCSPCKALLPVLERLEQEFSPQLQLVVVDVEQQPELMAIMQVRGLPSVLLYYHGREVSRFTTALPEGQIRQLLAPYIQQPGDRLRKQAEQCITRQDWQQGLALWRQLIEQQPGNAADVARYCQRLMDASKQQPQLLLDVSVLLDNAAAHIQRDPAIQQALSRWHLLQRRENNLDALRQRFRHRPTPANRLALAQELAAEEQYDQAFKLLIGLLRRPCPDNLEKQGQALLIELINILPDRARANRYRREWFSHQRRRGWSEEPDQTD